MGKCALKEHPLLKCNEKFSKLDEVETQPLAAWKYDGKGFMLGTGGLHVSNYRKVHKTKHI
jgi:hypothetical protein